MPRLDALLRRVTTMAVGRPASDNIVRRANAKARATTAGYAAILAHATGGPVTANTLSTRAHAEGLTGLAGARARARAAAERTMLAASPIDEDEESGP